MDVVARHFWVAFVIVTVLYARAWWREAQETMRRRPELVEGYRRLLRAQLTVGLAPALLMGAGVVLGRVRGVLDFLRPNEGNPFVLLWWGVVLSLVLILTGWVVLGSGAEMLERHPGVYGVPRGPARSIRLFCLAFAALNLLGAAMFFAGFAGSPGRRPEPDFPWFPFVFPVFFAGLWVGIGFLLAATGGWQTIATHYPVDGAVPDAVKRFQSAEFGFVGYNSVLKLGANQRGLYVAAILPFRAGHTPFFVPWTDVTARAARRWLRAVVELRFARTPDIAVRLPRAAAEALFRAGGRAADVPPAQEG